MKRNHMMAFATVALCLLASPLMADDKASQTADPVGVWAVVIEAEGQVFEPTMKVTRDGGELKVEYLTDEFGDHEAVDVKQDGGKLDFRIAVDAPEGAMELKFATKIDGNDLTGEVEYTVGDITGSADVEGKREVAANPAGTWNLTVEAEGQVFEPTLKVAKDGDNFSVEYLSDEFGDHEATDVKVDGDNMSFVIAVDAPEGSLKLTIAAKIDGDELSGEVEYEVGDITGTADIEGEREVAADPVGVWNVVVEAEGQVFEPVMKVTRDGGDLKVEYLTDEFGDHEAVDVKQDGDKLAFRIAVDAPEGSLELKFDTKIAGDELTGEVEYAVGDITGSADVEGKREAQAQLAGTWNVTVEAEGQVFEPQVKVTADGGEYAIEYLSDEFGDHEATDIKVDGDNVSFVIAVDAPEGSLKLTITAKIDGDKMNGEVEYEVGDITGTADLEAERE